MPRHEECRKTNPCFPKDYEDIVGHIMTEVNFFTPSEWRRDAGAGYANRAPYRRPLHRAGYAPG